MKVGLFSLMFFSLLICGCSDSVSNKFKLEKRFWEAADYNYAINHIQYDASNGDGLPRLSNPETAPVFLKLIDTLNVAHIFNDEQLGIRHRSGVASSFFKISNDLVKIYQVYDVQDKLIYPDEVVETIKFALYIQLYEFKLGNEAIKKESLSADYSDVMSTIVKNEQTIVNNFQIYIELLAREFIFSDKAKKKYAEMINDYYLKLINYFPNANYQPIKGMAVQIKEKIEFEELKKSLVTFINQIDAMEPKSLDDNS